MSIAWVLAVAACSALATPAQPRMPAGRSRACVLLGCGAFALSAGGARVETSMLRIKREAASRRRARAQETLRSSTLRGVESTVCANTPELLLPKPAYPPPAYPPPACSLDVGGGTTTSSREGGPHAELLLGQATCACEDLDDLRRKLARTQEDHRTLARRVLRLESLLADLVQTVQTSDDIALLERRTCSAVVYNEELTRSRPLRLLREDLKRLQEKYAL